MTQAVFLLLARKAVALCNRVSLTGWLYETTRLTARQLLRTRYRQQLRDQEVYMRSAENEAETAGVWRQLEPLLEEAMTRLSEKERALLALRYFENRTGAEAAALLGIGEWAAHKRAARALEKLRRFLASRGVDSTASTLAGAMSAHALQPAPAVLVQTVAAGAHGAPVSAATLTLIQGALKIMAGTKIKTTIAGLLILACLGGGATLWLVHEHRAASSQFWTPAQLVNAGYATPQDCLKTLLWGIDHGATEVVSASLTPEQLTGAEQVTQGKFEAKIAQLQGRMSNAAGFQVFLEQAAANDATIELNTTDVRGQMHVRKFWFRKVNGAWKCDQIRPFFDLTN